MAAFHILVGALDERDGLIRAAKRNIANWRVPRSALAGDDAVIFFGDQFFASAQIARGARGADGVYTAPLRLLQLIEPPISIDVIKKRVPGLKWATYPRSYTTPQPVIASQIRELIQSRSGHVYRNSDSEAADVEAIRRRKLKRTTEKALIDARRGQGRFRADLIKRWNGACAITRCELPIVLKASHIKPWRSCSDEERLDPANGLLLVANIDALFDSGLITFDDNGRMLVSNLVSTTERKRLGLPRSLVRAPDRREKQYLGQHRRSKFRGS
jgi:hypothetical protein